MNTAYLIPMLHEPLLVIAVFFMMSLVSAYVLFRFLKNQARIKTEYGSFGGAIAGFIAIFILLTYTYRSLSAVPEEPNFKIPQGFARFISKDYKIGFGYPASLMQKVNIFLPKQLFWGRIKSPDDTFFSVGVLPFKGGIEQELKNPTSFCEFISKMLFKSGQKAKCLDAVEYSVSGIAGIIAKIENSQLGGEDKVIKAFLLGIEHPSHNFIYYFNISSSVEGIDKAKIVFDKIVTTVTFLE